jgi:hypothetical protein
MKPRHLFLSYRSYPRITARLLLARSWAGAVRSLLAALGLMGLVGSAALAQDITYCTSCSPPYLPPSLWLTGSGWLQVLSGNCPWVHTVSAMTIGQGWGLVHSQGTALGAVYEVDIFQPSSNLSTDVIFNVASTNSDVGGVNNRAFQAAYSGDRWGLVCYLTNRVAVTQPEIEFHYVSGVNGRTYVDCIRFRQVGTSCINVANCSIQGPVSTDIPYVTVTGVTSASDLAIIIYQKAGSNVTTIGQLASGIVVGANQVPVTWEATSVGAQVAATQIDPSGLESCLYWPGVVVSGGVSPAITRIGIAGGQCSICGTGSVGRTFVLLQSGAAAAPMSSWTPAHTNNDGTGAFDFTVDPCAAQSMFFRVQAR